MDYYFFDIRLSLFIMHVEAKFLGILGVFQLHTTKLCFFCLSPPLGYETWWTRWFVANMWTWTPQEEMRGVRSTCWHEHGKSCSSKGAFSKITGRSPFRKGRELHQLKIAIFGGSTLAVWILFMFKKMFFSKRSALMQSMFKSFNEGYSGVLT